MPSDAPPSSAEVTTSLTCRDSVEVNAFTSSGITAPAKVPHEMMVPSFHHCEESVPMVGMISFETTYVNAMDTNDVSHTKEVSGASKFILSTLPYLAFANALLIK